MQLLWYVLYIFCICFISSFVVFLNFTSYSILSDVTSSIIVKVTTDQLVASSFGYFLCSQLYITNSRGRTIKFANSLLNTTVVAFKVHPLRSYAPMPAPSPPFKTILELVSWHGLQSSRCITPDVTISSKCLHFNISFIFGNRKSNWGLDPVNRQGVPTQLFV